MFYTFNFWLICFAFAVNAFFLTPLFSLPLELACEITFPIGEATSGGLVQGSFLLFTFLLGYVYTFILGDAPENFTCMYVLLANILLSIIGGFLLIPVEEDLKRTNAERTKSFVRESVILAGNRKNSVTPIQDSQTS